jgi:hypothetical protein
MEMLKHRKDFDDFCKDHPRIEYVTMGEVWNAASAKYAMNWQPIDTAPKDGTRFLAGHYRVRISQPNYFEWYIAVYAGECKIPTDDEEWGVEGNDGEFYCPEGFYREALDKYGEEQYLSAKPTHWMPVPLKTE